MVLPHQILICVKNCDHNLHLTKGHSLKLSFKHFIQKRNLELVILQRFYMKGVTSVFYNPLSSYYMTVLIVEDEIDSVLFTLMTSG